MAQIQGSGYPTFSPGSNYGPGTTYKDTSSGTIYTLGNDGIWKQASDGSQPANNNSVYDLINQAASTPAQNTLANIPSEVFQTTDPNTFLQKAYEELKPYYEKLLTEADGDVERAKTRLEEDWSKGVRQTSEDLTANLAKLGIDFSKEQGSLLDTLNKRGVALTQNPEGGLTYAGGGQAQTEYQQLSEDQKLRKEAEERTARRLTEQAGVTKSRGQEDVTRQDQLYREQLQSQKEQQGVARAGVYQGAEQQQKANQLNQSIYGAQTGTSQGTSNTSSLNPNDANSIKAAFQGYRAWNDSAAILADYKATDGAGKQ